jgi:deazaflavin-dependent oxidoreductase (nitroreductase family)
MAGFDPKVTSAIQTEREIELTTYGRQTGKPSRRILWVYGDDQRIFVRSGGGLGRDWPQNLLANGRGILHVDGHNVPVRAVHLTDIAASRRAGALGKAKYGENFSVSAENDEPVLGEQATFELMPDEG